MADTNQTRIENLGAAERTIQTLLTHADHMIHNRPGIVVTSTTTPMGVSWEAASYKVENGVKVAYFNRKIGAKTMKVRAGILGEDGKVREGTRVIGEYRKPGFFPEVASWMYRQIADVYKLDNEFTARWASYAFGQEHRDLKVALAAFMLVQPRRGDPIREGDAILFYDEDFRDVGEAMCLIRKTDGKDFNPKLLLRVGDLLQLPAVAQINRELGFSTSMKNPAMGRWEKVVEKYLRHRELNPKMLAGLVKTGQRTTVMALAQRVHYKPVTPQFYQTLRWKQVQAKDGRRTIAIGMDVAAAESWEGLNETQICERIMATKPSFKRLVGILPASVGLTRAVMAAAVEAGSLSNQDLIIATPTLEELGLTSVEPVKTKWENAIKNAENTRAANIAVRVKSQDVKNKMAEAADNAVKTAVAKVMKGLRIYFMVDVSGSMERSIEEAKEYIAQFLGGFPSDKLHVSIFNTSGTELVIKHPSKAGVEAAFRGKSAGGGTDYGAGVRALAHHKPAADEDALFIFVGDEEASAFDDAVRASGLNPVAFGFLKIGGNNYHNAVTETAKRLGIPCFFLDKAIFNDVYALPRTLSNLIASTPVGKPTSVAKTRTTLVETILKTEPLQKPAWAA